MADALWDLTGDPTYDKFVSEWMNLNPKEYDKDAQSPMSLVANQLYRLLINKRHDISTIGTPRQDIVS